MYLQYTAELNTIFISDNCQRSDLNKNNKATDYLVLVTQMIVYSREDALQNGVPWNYVPFCCLK